MKTVGAREARADWHSLLKQVSEGETITITRRGVPVAMLVPVAPKSTRDPAELIKEMLEFRKGRKLDGVSIRELIAEGRRF
jgi:prevent-host-death family protein